MVNGANGGHGTTTVAGGAEAAGRARGVLPFGSPGRWRTAAGRPGAAGLALAATFEREIDAGRGFLWLPVAFGIGILIYFALPAEPWAPALVAAAAVLVVAAWRARFRVVALPCCWWWRAASPAGVARREAADRPVAAPVIAREATVTVAAGSRRARRRRAGGARALSRSTT